MASTVKKLRSRKLKEKVKPPIVGGSIEPFDIQRTALKGKRFVFTSAQNNTALHEQFFNALTKFCDHRNAKLFVSRFSYNKAGFQNGTKEGVQELWYDPRLEPFIQDKSLSIKDTLIFCGELDILPTAENPLSGFDNYTKGASCIIPHAKMAMKSVPTMSDYQPKIMYTTGAITQRNYIQRKAGQKADFHHVFGAMYVEVAADGTWFARQLIANDDGSFYDLTDHFTADGVTHDHTVEALNYGDIHIEKIDPVTASVTFFENGNILDTLKPKYQLIHDLIDFEARNHHNIKDPFFWAEKFYAKKDRVEDCITKAAQFLKNVARPYSRTVVVESNHDLALKKWLSSGDARFDPVNVEFFHRASAMIHQQIAVGNPRFGIFEALVREHVPLETTEFLKEDQSFLVAGQIECGMHGHLGPNGARGNPRNIRGIGRKCNTGHTHSAGIIDGIYTAGVTGRLDMDYNKGPSSWSHSHIVTYPNGKRAIITIKNGKWRA